MLIVTTRCVLLDALGTLVELEPPWPLLAADLGLDVDDAERAMRAEMSYYRDHSHEGRDAESLADLRGMGLRLVCVSNWDVSLPSVLDHCGLAQGLDAVVTSAGAGARKPDPAIFYAGLNVAGCDAGDALHVGDTESEDVEGGRAAGIRALLIDREGGGDIQSLAAIRHHLDS